MLQAWNVPGGGQAPESGPMFDPSLSRDRHLVVADAVWMGGGKEPVFAFSATATWPQQRRSRLIMVETAGINQHCYPMWVSLADRVCLVVGGGSVGERKIRKLLQCGACVHLVAQELTAWLQEQSATGKLRHLGRHYQQSFLDGVDLVFAATSDAQLNRTIADQAAARRLWCNMATEPKRGSFFVPASFQRGPLIIAIGTSGLSPAAAAGIRRRLERQFQGPWTFYLTLLGEFRTAIQGQSTVATDHQELFRRLAALPLLDWIEDNQLERARRALAEACSARLSADEIEQIWDRAWKSSFGPLRA